MTGRRSVGVDQAFFDDLDRPDYRVLVVVGTHAAASVVIGQPVADDGIVLLGIELDLDWPDEHLD